MLIRLCLEYIMDSRTNTVVLLFPTQSFFATSTSSVCQQNDFEMTHHVGGSYDMHCVKCSNAVQ